MDPTSPMIQMNALTLKGNQKYKKNRKNKCKKVPNKINRFGEEVHTLLYFATKAMNNAKAEKRRKTKHKLFNFERLTVSDSETYL